jgi:hypothetical protein
MIPKSRTMKSFRPSIKLLMVPYDLFFLESTRNTKISLEKTLYTRVRCRQNNDNAVESFEGT